MIRYSKAYIEFEWNFFVVSWCILFTTLLEGNIKLCAARIIILLLPRVLKFNCFEINSTFYKNCEKQTKVMPNRFYLNGHTAWEFRLNLSNAVSFTRGSEKVIFINWLSAASRINEYTTLFCGLRNYEQLRSLTNQKTSFLEFRTESISRPFQISAFDQKNLKEFFGNL